MGKQPKNGRLVEVILPDELIAGMKEWAKEHHQNTLLLGMGWSAAVRHLIKKGLEAEGIIIGKKN